MKALFIPCTVDGLPKDSGSARIRAKWICEHWDEATYFNGRQTLAEHDLIVFQKAYLVDRTTEMISQAFTMRNRGRCRLAFDLCDPDWLDPEHERRLLKVLPMFDFAVAPTESIAEWLGRWMPAYVIPDRVDLDDDLPVAELRHTDRPSLVWGGYAGNSPAVETLAPVVNELGLDLTIIAPMRPLPFHEFWSKIAEHDVLLNPRPDTGPVSFKSDNKTVIAWAMGLPVARTAEDVRRLCDPFERAAEILRRVAEVRERWDVKISVQEWRKLAEDWCGIPYAPIETDVPVGVE